MSRLLYKRLGLDDNWRSHVDPELWATYMDNIDLVDVTMM